MVFVKFEVWIVWGWKRLRGMIRFSFWRVYSLVEEMKYFVLEY